MHLIEDEFAVSASKMQPAPPMFSATPAIARQPGLAGNPVKPVARRYGVYSSSASLVLYDKNVLCFRW